VLRSVKANGAVMLRPCHAHGNSTIGRCALCFGSEYPASGALCVRPLKLHVTASLSTRMSVACNAEALVVAPVSHLQVTCPRPFICMTPVRPDSVNMSRNLIMVLINIEPREYGEDLTEGMVRDVLPLLYSSYDTVISIKSTYIAKILSARQKHI